MLRVISFIVGLLGQRLVSLLYFLAGGKKQKELQGSEGEPEDSKYN